MLCMDEFTNETVGENRDRIGTEKTEECNGTFVMSLGLCQQNKRYLILDVYTINRETIRKLNLNLRFYKERRAV